MTKTPPRSPTRQRGAKAVSRQHYYLYLFQFQNLNKILKKQRSFRNFFTEKKEGRENWAEKLGKRLLVSRVWRFVKTEEEKLKRLGHLLLRFISKSRYCFYFFFFFSLIHLGFVNSMGVCCLLVLPILLVWLLVWLSVPTFALQFWSSCFLDCS